MTTLVWTVGLLAIAPQWLGAGERDDLSLLTRQNADGSIPGWQSFHEGADTKTGDVWRIQRDGVLVCRGMPKGYLYTEQDYTDVHLEFEWRWPTGSPGNGGLLLRVTGENKIWPKSLEVQLNNGQAGDFWGLVGYELQGAKDRMKVLHHDDFGKLTNVKHTMKTEKPAGEWNHCEVTLQGGDVTVKINGRTVNQATDCEVAAGKIVLTAEGQEIHFRNFRLLP
jgi:hypothetical protein